MTMRECSKHSEPPVPESKSPFELLAEELGAVAGQIERETKLRIDAALSDIGRINAERELRLTLLEQRLADRVAQVRDGEPGPAGRDGKDGEPVSDEALEAAVRTWLAANPPAPGQPGPAGRDGKDGEPVSDEALEAAVRTWLAANPPAPGQPGPAGRDGKDGRDGRDLEHVQVDRDDGDLILSFSVGDIEYRYRVPLEPGPAGRDGVDGKDGKLPAVRAWTPGVHHEGDVRTHAGASWQARCDTAQEPPGDDWVCLAERGAEGAPGRGFKALGLWQPDISYELNDVVALNGASFVAIRNEPGVCPGEGWRLLAQRGERGSRGEKGDRGDRGPPGPRVEQLHVDGEGMLTLVNSDGSAVQCDLYPLLSKLRG
ncbi:hypothetical protein ACFQ1E_17360 [Sphingomonas canadensis]|uniref:Collagen-like protein n=1 Tax=Sphingomonas canadensis TaxID=1219257 RepID=A0ABW3HBP8_9SPHN